MPGVSLDVSTMKVPDLKKELKARGLTISGNKDELRERLEEALIAAGEVDLDEDKVLGEDVEVEVDEDTEKALLEGKAEPVVAKKRVSISNAAPEIKIMKLDETAAQTSTTTDEGKTAQEKRAERFGMPLTAEAQKVARAARFGIVNPAEKKAARAARFGIAKAGAKVDANVNKKPAAADIDQLKARAARFGEISSKTLKKVTLLEKKKERAQKFKSDAAKVPETKVEKTVPAIAKHAPITMGDSKEAALKRSRAERFAAK